MPQITASVEHTEQLIPLDVSFDLTLNDLSAYIGAETGEETESFAIVYNGTTFTSDQGEKTLTQLGLQPDDFISVVRKGYQQQQQSQSQTQAQAQSGGIPNDVAMQLEMMRQQLISNPPLLQQMSTMNPQITSTIHDPAAFAQMMRPFIDAGMFSGGGMGMGGGHPMASNGYPGGATRDEWERLQRTKDSPESKLRIQQLEDLEHNFQMAMEETPEMFGSVIMLYVSLEVNGVPVKAFVDSGAQTTIMSPRMVEKCGLTHLVDKRFQGIAQGVGQSAILGRVLVAPMSISGSYLPVSLTVLDAGVDMLLGLDMLRRHQASIDLKRNVLVIGDVEAPFLPESELPKGIFNQGPPTGQTLGSGPGIPLSSSVGGAIAGGSATAAAAAAAARRAQAGNPLESPATTAPSSSASTNAAVSASSASSTTSNFPESSISNLVNLGFSRKEAVSALEMAGGNAEVAASILFQ